MIYKNSSGKIYEKIVFNSGILEYQYSDNIVKIKKICEEQNFDFSSFSDYSKALQIINSSVDCRKCNKHQERKDLFQNHYCLNFKEVQATNKILGGLEFSFNNQFKKGFIKILVLDTNELNSNTFNVIHLDQNEIELSTLTNIKDNELISSLEKTVN